MCHSRSLRLALASAVTALAGFAALLAAPGAGTPDAGEVPVRATTLPTAAPAPVADASGPKPPGPDPAPSEVPVRSGRLEDLPPAAPAPVRVRLDALAIDVPVVPVGVEAASGAVAVPDDVDVAGWYRFGPAPGSPGSAVVTAHVDSARQGAGAFFPLRTVELGAEVAVTLEDGTERRFTVVGRRSYPKASLPVDELFTRSGDPVLTLITCGGAFDPATRSYEENLVVFATPS